MNKLFQIWFERPLPPPYAPLLNGVAEAIGATTQAHQKPQAALGQAQAIIAGGRLAYNAALMDQAPRLRVISRTGIGLDNVDLAAATVRGIAVCNAPDAPTISTAEHTVALIMAVAKQLKWCDQSLQQGGQADYFNRYNGLELQEAILGLVGLGRIGGHVAKLGQGLGMTVLAFDPWIAPERAASLNVTLVPTLAALLGQADVVSLHVPLTPDTNHLINAERLGQMKPGAILINAARGGLVHEPALLDALERGQLRGAGLDVFSTEPPPPDHPLVGRNDVIVTPHIAAASNAGKDRLWRTAISQALQLLQGQRPPYLVNPEVLGN